jgi:opacity protein-like surface antigen
MYLRRTMSPVPHSLKRVVVVLSAAIVLALVPSSARAQTFFIPFMGANFGGDVDCPSAPSCAADPSVTLGAAYGYFNDLIGLEEDFGYVLNPFRDDPPTDSRAITLMSNVMVGPLLGLVRPYGLIGAGFMRVSMEPSPTRTLVTEHTDFGWDVGGGVLVAYGHIGLRADLRFFRTFNNIQAKGFPVSGDLNFGRASIGLVIQ